MNTPRLTNEVRVYNLTLNRMVSYFFDTYEDTAEFIKRQKKNHPDTRLYYVRRPCGMWNAYCIARGAKE